MILEDFFTFVDKLLRIEYMPLAYVSVLPMAIFTPLLAILFWMLDISTIRRGGEVGSKGVLSLAPSILCLAIVVYRAMHLFLLLGARTASLEYIVSTVMTAFVLMSLLLMRPKMVKEQFLLFLTLVFVLAGSSLEVNLLNYVDAQETTLDTLNIFITGGWRFSYHSGTYDALPYDCVLKVFMLNILGLKEPTCVIPDMILDCSIAVVTTFSVILFVRYLNLPFTVGLLTAITLSSMGYLGPTVPPGNFSLMFSILFIAILSKCMVNGFRQSYVLLMNVFFACGILAHEMTALLLIPLGILFFSLVYSTKVRGEGGGIHRYLKLLICFCLVVWLTILVYTGMLMITYAYVHRYVQNLLGGIATGPGRTTRSFEYMPVSIKVVYLLPLAIVCAFMVNIFKDMVFKQRTLFKNKTLDSLFMSIYIGGIVTGLASGLSLLGHYTMTAHLGAFAFLYMGLGMVPIFARLLYGRIKKRRSVIAKRLLIAIIIIVVSLGFLTPHKMPDQYVYSESLRGGTLEDYNFSEFLIGHTQTSSKSYEIIVVQTSNTTKGTLTAALPISLLKYLLLTKEPPPPATIFHQYYASDLDQTAKADLMSKPMVYSSGYYDVFIKT